MPEAVKDLNRDGMMWSIKLAIKKNGVKKFNSFPIHLKFQCKTWVGFIWLHCKQLYQTGKNLQYNGLFVTFSHMEWVPCICRSHRMRGVLQTTIVYPKFSHSGYRLGEPNGKMTIKNRYSYLKCQTIWNSSKGRFKCKLFVSISVRQLQTWLILEPLDVCEPTSVERLHAQLCFKIVLLALVYPKNTRDNL